MGDERYFDVLNRSITFQMGRSIDLWGDYYDIALDSNGHRPGFGLHGRALGFQFLKPSRPDEDNNQDFHCLRSFKPMVQ